MLDRKVKRNLLKKKLGTNQIQEEWHKMQIKEYGGEKQYNIMRNRYKKRRKSLFERVKESFDESNLQ